MVGAAVHFQLKRELLDKILMIGSENQFFEDYSFRLPSYPGFYRVSIDFDFFEVVWVFEI